MLAGKLAVQVPGQLIPAGLLVMVPDPAAGAATVKAYVVGGGCVPMLEPPPQLARKRTHRAAKDVPQTLNEGFTTEGPPEWRSLDEIKTGVVVYHAAREKSCALPARGGILREPLVRNLPGRSISTLKINTLWAHFVYYVGDNCGGECSVRKTVALAKR